MQEGRPVRLWYQSLSRPDAWAGYQDTLRRILDTAREPDTEIELHGIERTGGIANQYRYLEYLEIGEVIENLQAAMRRGFDAFLIGNIADPGLRECREIADIPVLGLCESSLHVASIMGGNFALVTLNEKYTPRIVENVDRAGLRSRLQGTYRLALDRILDLGQGFGAEENRHRLVAAFQEVAGTAVDQGAEVVIPAGGVAMALLAEAGIHDAGRGAPLLNGILALVKAAEMAVGLNRRMGGRFVSKRLLYAPPGAGQMAEIRRHYGDVYPTFPITGVGGEPA